MFDFGLQCTLGLAVFASFDSLDMTFSLSACCSCVSAFVFIVFACQRQVHLIGYAHFAVVHVWGGVMFHSIGGCAVSPGMFVAWLGW